KAVQSQEGAFSAGGGGLAQRFGIEGSAEDGPGEFEEEAGFLARELQFDEVGVGQRGDGGGVGRGVKAVLQWNAGQFGEAAAENAGKGEIDLLADDGPDEAVENGVGLADAHFLAPRNETGQTEALCQANEGGGVLLQTQEANDKGVSLGGVAGRGDFSADAIGTEVQREQGGGVGETDGGGVGVASQALGEALGVASQGAAEIGQGIAWRKREGEGVGGRQGAKGAGSEAVDAAEVFVEGGEGVEADLGGNGGNAGAAVKQFETGRVEAGAEEEICGRGMI